MNSPEPTPRPEAPPPPPLAGREDPTLLVHPLLEEVVAVDEEGESSSEGRFPLFNRELSWLSFNGRVLQEAADSSVPLFERLNFLAIFSSNLDEFFRVRVAYWRTLLRLKKKKVRKLSVNPLRLLREILKVVQGQQERFGEVFRGQILPELERHGIFLVSENAVSARQGEFLRRFFQETVLPHLTPLTLDVDAPPFLEDRAIYLLVELWPEETISLAPEKPQYALVEVPSRPLDRFVVLPADGDRHVVMFLDDVIRYNLPSLFPGYEVGGSYAVKLSRDAELYIEDEFSGDIVEAIRKSLKKRETGPPSRFLYDLQASYALVAYLQEVFKLQDEDLVLGGRYHNLDDLRDFPRFELEGLSYPPWPPLPYGDLDAAPRIFDAMLERDRLLHFPYHSYEYVVRFLSEAAADPDVEEIWLTVYRVSRESAVLNALLEAAEQGKKVRVFVEVQARFDEAANLRWAERLEEAGVITMYSIPGIKVHAKLAMVARREHGERRLYTYLSTGNFNESTARFYADFGLLTADPRLTKDVEEVLRYLVGEIEEPVFSHLLVAPFTFRETCYRFLDQEVAAAREGRPSGITLKMNALEDEEIIGRLYQASAAGVPIQLVIRGICCLVPGLDGLSETVRARSIVDRYLEHGRVYSFHNGGDERLYLASGDWMYRNLSQRVEVAFPIYDPDVRKQIRTVLDLQLTDNVRARVLDERQSNPYARDGGAPVRAQEATRRLIASNYVSSILSGSGGRTWARRARGAPASGASSPGGSDGQHGRGRTP